MPQAAPLEAWHDFFMMIGTASATLIGAMFVVVSIGMGFLNRKRSVAIRTFLTPTVTHLSTVLLICALTMVPVLGEAWLAAIAGVAGLAGIAYSGRVIRGFRQHEGTDRSDWFWYAIFPPFGYALLFAAAISALALRMAIVSVELLAAALGLLLIAGIRNAWDMILFFVMLDRSPVD
jgi:hypothetical protein